MKRIARRAISFLLALSFLMSYAPVLPIAYAAEPKTLTIANGNIRAIVSTENGGFVIRTVAGDVIAKDDDNKDLLYRSGAFDTSFTSFRVTEQTPDGLKARDYIFGNDYSYLGLGGGSPTVTQEDTGIRAVWTVDDLTFTQFLEPVLNEGSNEHGTVRISYSVTNAKGTPVKVQVRLLLDSALGTQDYAHYELKKSSDEASGYDEVVRECVLRQKSEYIPPSFFAYDDYNNPSIAAYTVTDFSENAVRPYQVAFGHWNNLASTVFDFEPDGDLTFTNPFNRSYLTADSALAFYYNLGSVEAGESSSQASVYYGVDSKVRVKSSDLIGFTVACPPALTFGGWAGDPYYYAPGSDDPSDLEARGVFEVTTHITNLPRDGAERLEHVKIAVLVDDGMAPQGVPFEDVDNKYPTTVDIGALGVGQMKTLTWNIKAAVGETTSYRRLVFRAYDVSESGDGPLVLDDLIGSSTAYILCPGKGGVPDITFNSLSPRMVYNEGTRHLYIAGTGFDLLKADLDSGADYPYELKAYLKGDRKTSFTVPSAGIIFSNDEPGVMEVVLKEPMPPGEYELVFHWQTPPPGIDKDMTAPALSFLVTTDPSHRNDTYGVIAIVKTGKEFGSKYEIKAFDDEDTFRAFREDEETKGEVLLEFRGVFVLTLDSEGAIKSCSAVTTGDDDTITINNSLDFEDGNVQIYRADDKSVMVEFDGDLYTSNSRTSVWSGNASLTPLVEGVDFGLIKYDERGERVTGQQPLNTISIVWPSGYNMLQTIGGLAVDFRYGQFGAMYSDEDCENRLGYIVSFGGKLDLSFLIPGGSEESEELEREKDKKNNTSGSSTPSGSGSGLSKDVSRSPSADAMEENEKNKVEPAGKVNIEDVLFGNNKGYLGFNSSAEIMLPKYVHPLPAMGGKLDINTIGGYQVGVFGKVKTVKMEFEFELKVKNAPGDSAPIPDKLYIFISGFEPGINIDGVGAVWITGAGGGVDNLYDTIFSDGGMIPLTVLLSASFDIMKVMSGRADLALSLMGFQFKFTDVKFKNTDKVVLNSGIVNTQWSPDFLLQISAWLNLMKVIEGKTYLVVDGDFFEFFARATVTVPKDVDIVGGMAVGNVDFGGNDDKVWGVLSALGIKLGVTYYWGGDVHFGTGAKTSSPTYPELLGMPGIPVGITDDDGETIYLRVGTNLSAPAAAEIVESLDTPVPELMEAPAAPVLRSSTDKTAHQMIISDPEDDVALVFTFKGDDRPMSVEDVLGQGVDGVVVKEPALTINRPKPDGTPGGSQYDLTFYQDGADPMACNANLIVDDNAGTTEVNVTFTEDTDGTWTFATPQAADVVLYRVGSLPEVSTFSASGPADGKVQLGWTGTSLDETEISLYLTPSIGNGSNDIGEIGTLVSVLGGVDGTGAPRTPPSADGGTIMLDLAKRRVICDETESGLPLDLPSGNYYVRMIVSKEDEVNQTIVALSESDPFMFTYTNPEQPGAPGKLELENCGNNMLNLTVGTPPAEDFDGYLVSVYEDSTEGLVETYLQDVPFEKDDEDSIPEMLLGGNYSTTDGTVYGLTPGKSYVARVAAYRVHDNGTAADESDDILIRGGSADTKPVSLIEATAPEVYFVAPAGACVAVSKTVVTDDDEATTIWVDTFTDNEVEFALESNVPVSGHWSIDGALALDLLDPAGSAVHEVSTSTRVEISETLCDGEHTLLFAGSDAEGDSFIFRKTFAVDTMPPRLVLSSPIDGSFYDHDKNWWRGTVRVSGLGDKDARFTVLVDGVPVLENSTLPVDSDGSFEYVAEVSLWDVSHEITVVSEDVSGNSVSRTVTVQNPGLGNTQPNRAWLKADGQVVQNIALKGNGDTTETTMSFVIGAYANDLEIRDSHLVRWTAVARQGSAEIDPNGKLTISPNSVGYVEGEYQISSGASAKALATFGAEAFGDRTYSLQVRAQAGGQVYDSNGQFVPGTTVSIGAIPYPNYQFVGWESSNGGAFENEDEASTTFAMPAADTVVTAMFEPIKWTLTVNGSEGGSATGSGAYAAGTGVTLVATPASGYQFDGWEVSPYVHGGIGFRPFEPSTVFTMPGMDMTITAVFSEIPPSSWHLQVVVEDETMGTASGEGYYLVDSMVTLVATPEPGYRFDGWESSDGGEFADPSAAETMFTMPDNDTVVTAKFSALPPEDDSEEDDEEEEIEAQAFGTMNSFVSITLPESFAGDPSSVVAYYMSGGRRVLVPFSYVVDGRLVFLAPASATFYAQGGLHEEFSDAKGHWGQDAIDFAVARGLFNGIGGGLFGPDGHMTRAMFTTVLARLDGAGLGQYSGSAFSDVPSGNWYSAAVEWASGLGLVGGVSDTEFGPDAPITREQMAAMLARYLAYRGLVLERAGQESGTSFNDGDSISDWARAAVELMREYGIITGRPGNMADPQGSATRAEGCAVFMRLIRAVLNR